MTEEEIIEMARQAGIDIGIWEKLSDNDDVFGYDFCGIHENLEAFAKMVAEHEREECKKLCTWKTGNQFVDEAVAVCYRAINLMGTFDTKDIYRAVEQALKEKNK